MTPLVQIKALLLTKNNAQLGVPLLVSGSRAYGLPSLKGAICRPMGNATDGTGYCCVILAGAMAARRLWMAAPAVPLSRAQRRALVKEEKKKQRPARKQVSTVTNLVRRVVFRQQFSDLLVKADGLCVSSNAPSDIAAVVGRLLFVTAKAVSLEEMEVEEPDVIRALSLVDSTLSHIVRAGEIDAQQRKDLLAGLEYLDALSRAVSTDALDMAWWLLDQLITKGPGFGDDEIPLILDKITKKRADSTPETAPMNDSDCIAAPAPE